MRIAVYVRVSTSDQDCTIQTAEIERWVAAQGKTDWQIVKHYADSGFSGAKASRPALDQLMNDAKAGGLFECVCVYKLDRFGRSVLNLNQSLALLESYKVRFIATSQNIDTDSSSPTSRLLLNILGCISSFELELLRERTLLGVRAAKASGKHVGRPKRVFRRDVVAQLRAEGLSWRKISDQLGVPVSTCIDALRCTENVPSKTA
jgi:DNA invertase Pin-like site-specific DNA recombinase